MPTRITLTTDFGTTDWFVGTMKGVIARIAPNAEVVDLTHGVAPGDIRAGAFALAMGYRFFPRGTVHVAVVDPGVGTKRKVAAVRTERYVFIGPDNGVLCWALRHETVREIRSVENQSYFLQPVSRTFHGRDIFAPVAAQVSRGLPLRRLGPLLDDLVQLPWPEPRLSRTGLAGAVLYLDRFGNAITNVPGSALGALGGGRLAVYRGRRKLCQVAECYDAVSRGKAVAVPGSSGYLEVAVNGGNAAHRFQIRPGDELRVRPG